MYQLQILDCRQESITLVAAMKN